MTGVVHKHSKQGGESQAVSIGLLEEIYIVIRCFKGDQMPEDD